MRLIIETDLGHDPDDFFAITYLLAAGVDIALILITPGDPDQIAIARLICDECSPRTRIGVPKLGRTKLSSGSIHHEMLKRYGRSLTAEADEVGTRAIYLSYRPDDELFIIGPVTSVGAYLKDRPSDFKRATMQGGFVSYTAFRPSVVLPQFEGKSFMPTFNLNGDRKGAEAFLAADLKRQMVGKNVCHTILFDRARFASFKPPTSRAAELFHEAATLYFAKHDSKKFHDPIAAVCHLHPEVGQWAGGHPVKMGDGWGTAPGDDAVLVDLDRDKAWDYLGGMT